MVGISDNSSMLGLYFKIILLTGRPAKRSRVATSLELDPEQADTADDVHDPELDKAWETTHTQETLSSFIIFGLYNFCAYMIRCIVSKTLLN